MKIRTDAKREAIVEAASAVFLESGFEGASMAEIATRVGGSKATLYGYFCSKEALFLEVMHRAAQRHFEPIFAALEQDPNDLPKALQRFGERSLTLLCMESSIQARRVIIAESGRSDIGSRFFECGPKKGLIELADFLQQQMAKGKLRPCNAWVAARHLTALLDSETVALCLFGLEKTLSTGYIRQAVARALETFLMGYAPRPDSATGTYHGDDTNPQTCERPI